MRKSKTGVKRKRKRRVASPERKKEIADTKLWRQRALARANHQCEWCGAKEYLNVHHIIGRRYKPTRTDPLNSIVLCPSCHKFSPGKAAHENPIRVALYLMDTRPLTWDYLKGYIKEYLGYQPKERTY